MVDSCRGSLRPFAVLVAARDDVSKWSCGGTMSWPNGSRRRIFLDRSKDRGSGDIDDLTAKVGQCSLPDKSDVVENALRGS